VFGVLFAVLAVLGDFQLLRFIDYFAFVGKVVDGVALAALEFDAALNFGHKMRKLVDLA
jgi:hypothetical protein